SVEINSNEGLFIRSAIPIRNKTWENYNGEFRITPKAIFEPTTLEDLIDIVNLARKNNKTIRCAAQGHTVSSLSVTKNYLVIVNKLNKITVQKHFKYGWTVTAEAGTSLLELDNALRYHDPPLTLDSEAIYDSFRVSGVVAVGAHGAKPSSGIMPDQVCSMTIVTGSGKLCEFSEEKNKLEFNAAKVNLGLLGIIYTVTFRTKPMYNLRLSYTYVPVTWLNYPLRIKHLLETSDSIQLYYFPYNGFNTSEDPNFYDFTRDQIVVKRWERTNEPVSFTQQQLEQTHETQRQNFIKIYEIISSNLPQNPRAVANVAAKILSANKNTSFVFQAPEAIHSFAYEPRAKYDLSSYTFKVYPDFSNVAAEFYHGIKTPYEFAKEGKYPLNYLMEFRILKSDEALLSPTFNHDPNVLYCSLDYMTITGTPNYEEFVTLMAQRFFNKYKAKWEFIPNVLSYLADVYSDQIKLFEKVRAKYDPDKIFFDNKSLEEIFNGALYK
ncbi:45579_t:CDS:2, partial [Gigaspora margarita]